MPKSLVLDTGLEPIAGYKLVRLLGRGGFGEVWEATAPGDFRVALKFIRLGTNESGVEEGSLNVIRNIRHPHLLDVQFATHVEDCLVIATPLCDESLLDELRANPAGLPRRKLLVYMDELSRAIDFLNEPTHRSGDEGLVGVQHRDIKPHNIFLVGGSVRLADFGLAKVVAATSARHSARAMSVHYVAPETFDGRVARQSDQYSLATTYFQLRTGKLPFDADSDVQIMYAHLHKDPDLSVLPEPERAVVARALAKRPEDRWPGCRAFVRALIETSGSDSRDALASDEQRVGREPVNAVTLPATEMSPPIPITQVAQGNTAGVATTAADSRHYPLMQVGLAVVIASLAAAIVIPRFGSSGNKAAPGSPGSAAVSIPTPVAKAHVSAPPLVEPRPPQPIPPDPRESAEKTKHMPVHTPPDPPRSITSSIGMKLVLIPAGEFLMGSPDSDEEAGSNERPQHRVRITRPFYLGVHEVTQGQYRAVTSENPSHFTGSDDLPVEEVSWNDAVAFCDKLSEREGLKPYSRLGIEGESGGVGYRLPTEAEWEYACRAGSTSVYSFGNDPASLGVYAWLGGNSREKAHPVGQKRPNAFGLYDMHGNVWEWCWDGYAGSDYPRSPGAGLVGPSQASSRMIRGGSWYDNARSERSAYRSWRASGHRINDLGFRVARVQSAQ